LLFAFKDAFGCSIVLAGFVTGCKPQGTSAFTAHISLVYGVYLVFHLSGAIPKPAFKKKESCCFVSRSCLRSQINLHCPYQPCLWLYGFFMLWAWSPPEDHGLFVG